MPELPRCLYCDQTIDEEKDKHVRVDSAPEKPPRIAHATCHHAVVYALTPR
jgi:hypothetical protein